MNGYRYLNFEYKNKNYNFILGTSEYYRAIKIIHCFGIHEYGSDIDKSITKIHRFQDFGDLFNIYTLKLDKDHLVTEEDLLKQILTNLDHDSLYNKICENYSAIIRNEKSNDEMAYFICPYSLKKKQIINFGIMSAKYFSTPYFMKYKICDNISRIANEQVQHFLIQSFCGFNHIKKLTPSFKHYDLNIRYNVHKMLVIAENLDSCIPGRIKNDTDYMITLDQATVLYKNMEFPKLNDDNVVVSTNSQHCGPYEFATNKDFSHNFSKILVRRFGNCLSALSSIPNIIFCGSLVARCTNPAFMDPQYDEFYEDADIDIIYAGNINEFQFVSKLIKLFMGPKSKIKHVNSRVNIDKTQIILNKFVITSPKGKVDIFRSHGRSPNFIVSSFHIPQVRVFAKFDSRRNRNSLNITPYVSGSFCESVKKGYGSMYKFMLIDELAESASDDISNIKNIMLKYLSRGYKFQLTEEEKQFIFSN